MSLYNMIEKVMLRHFNSYMFHKPIDVIISESQIIKDKYKFPCEKQHTYIIDGYEIITHHYKCKYKDVLIYFPGGAFTDPPTLLHYKFAKKIAGKLKRHVIMIQYPLFPIINPKKTTLVVKKVIERLNIKNFSIIGDSAGANLAIYLLEKYNLNNKNIINKIILISPFIDARFNEINNKLIKDNDFILDVDNCNKIAKYVYSKYLNGSLYLFPNNSFMFESEVLIISGGHEIFSSSINSWLYNQKVLKVKHYLYNNMCHCFTLLPIKQSSDAIKIIKDFLC